MVEAFLFPPMRRGGTAGLVWDLAVEGCRSLPGSVWLLRFPAEAIAIARPVCLLGNSQGSSTVDVDVEIVPVTP